MCGLKILLSDFLKASISEIDLIWFSRAFHRIIDLYEHDFLIISVLGLGKGLKVILINTQVVLLRCGQPLTAIGSKRSREDEKLINHTLGGASKGFIIDTRSQAAAMNSRSKGTSETIVHFVVELNGKLE